MTESEYRAHPAINWSLLKEMQKSPAHLIYRAANPREDTPSLRLGRALHGMVLQPDTFTDHFAVRPEFNGKGSGAERKAWDNEHAEFCIITQEEKMQASCMAESILAHPAAATLIDSCNLREEALFAPYANGVIGQDIDLKGRIDGYSAEFGTLIDIKTTVDASKVSAAKTVANYWYHGQMAYYSLICETNNLPISEAVLIFVEKSAPYQVAVYTLPEEALMLGVAEYTRLLDAYIYCQERDEWPGYSDEIEILDLPKWAYNNNEIAMVNYDY